MTIKYRPCCDRRCCLCHCKTSSAGGCYCVCRIVDSIQHLQDVIDGIQLGGVYIPHPLLRQQYWNKLSPEMQKEYTHYRTEVAPKHLKEAKEKLKTYEIADGNP